MTPRPLCEQHGPGAKIGQFLDVAMTDALPAPVHSEDRVVQHGYAVDIGTWHFFLDLPPALTFGRAARMSIDCHRYTVRNGAFELRHCLQHGDERVLYVRNAGPSLDVPRDDITQLERWLLGVKRNPQSSHWHPPAALTLAVSKTSAAAGTEKRCAVYLHFDAADLLLYVGISESPVVRGKQHAAGSTWTQFAVRHEGVWCDDRRAAERKEVELIRTLRPLFNEKHATPDRDERLVAYLVSKGRLDLLTPAISRG